MLATIHQRTQVDDSYSPWQFFFLQGFPSTVGACFSWSIYPIGLVKSTSKTLFFRAGFAGKNFKLANICCTYPCMKGRLIVGGFRQRIWTAVGVVQMI